jgi:hypothetical protein
VQNKGVLARLLGRAKVKQKPTADYRGIPTHACPCGSVTFKVIAVFNDFEIALYALDAECYSCGALVTVPTPLEKNGI